MITASLLTLAYLIWANIELCEHIKATKDYQNEKTIKNIPPKIPEIIRKIREQDTQI